MSVKTNNPYFRYTAIKADGTMDENVLLSYEEHKAEDYKRLNIFMALV